MKHLRLLLLSVLIALLGACASGELAAAWMTGGSLPDWGQSFTLSRFNGQEPGRVAEEGLL